MSQSMEINVLGELAVRVEGEPRRLPRSRKTRALLAYLAVTGRRHRRDRLCDLLWDVVDDRRGALRWSLSKLRKVLGPLRAQLSASRDYVELTIEPNGVDVNRLRKSSVAGFATQPTEALEHLAESCRGELLEGLFLPDFNAFEAWLEAERADARRMHARLCRVLVERLHDEPERALGHARSWFQQSGEQEAQSWIKRLSAEAGARVPAASRAASVGLEKATPVAEAKPPEPSRALIGRDSEMARLRMIADEARSQHATRIVLLIGEPGMGKTRLLEELRFREHQSAPSVVTATFYEAERNRPLAPFLDATRESLEITATEASDGEAPDREQLFETIATVIRRGAEDAGLGLLLLDDAHLCDPSSCELLHFIVRTAVRSPLLTVAACRPAELVDNPALSRALAGLRRRHLVEEIVLEPLDEAALRALITSASPGADRAAREQLVSSSHGNPLMALELARAAGSVPQTLSDLVLARLDGLPEGAAALIRWAAVLEYGSLRNLSDASSSEVDDFVAALETATRYEFLRVDEGRAGIFTMAHALIQRVVYESISPVRRAAMHRGVAELLSRDGSAERSSIIIYHATRADRPDLAAHALVLGADGCASIGAVGEAAALADQALTLLERLDPATSVVVELGALLVLAQVRRPEDPATFVAKMTELGLSSLDHGRTDLAHRAFQGASNLRWEAGAGGEGYGLARQAWHASRTGTTTERVRASSFMAMCLALMEKQLPDAHAIVHEAEALARADKSAVEPAELSLARSILHLHAGRFADARRDAVDSRTLARLGKGPLFEAMALQILIQIELAAGQKAAWRAAGEELTALATRIREGGEGALAAAAVALAEDSLEEARISLGEATQELRDLDDKRRLAWVANRWAHRERTEGDVDAARRLATKALAAAQAVEAMSEAAIAACELLAIAMRDADDPAYSEAEDTLADIEASTTLAYEARRLIEEVTAPMVRP